MAQLLESKFWLYFDCILTAFWLHLDGILTAFWLHFDCIFDCILTAFWLHFDCILTAFWLPFDWIFKWKLLIWIFLGSLMKWVMTKTYPRPREKGYKLSRRHINPEKQSWSNWLILCTIWEICIELYPSMYSFGDFINPMDTISTFFDVFWSFFMKFWRIFYLFKFFVYLWYDKCASQNSVKIQAKCS